MLLFCAYFGLCYWWVQSVNVSAAHFRAEVLWGAELQVLVPMLAYSLRNALVYGAPDKWVPHWLNVSSQQLGLASELVDSLSFGSAGRGVRPALTSSPAAYSLLLENGCVHNEVGVDVCANYGKKSCNYYYAYSGCYMPPGNTDITYSVFGGGVVGKGLLPALRQFVLVAGNLIRERGEELAGRAGQQLPRMDLMAAPLTTMDQLGRLYLPAGLGKLSEARIGEDVAYLTQFAQLNLLATLLCLVALVGFYLLAYRPLFAGLDKDIKRTRGLLLLLPEEAAKAVPAVMGAGKRLLGGA